ncbi:uncharacterized protein LOC115787182 [Archocentrus centrarchus]|uniref:uncharacterized protein LOC115787182 n=1 Tax=Archocentrus centrarchus TaxID=63155 RepID=UPI0011EA29E5|nr:uncharacterized protein LOC115787182 [Archocentrus centrarchus]
MAMKTASTYNLYVDIWSSPYMEGVETHCDGRQNGTQCYGALGGTVDIQLINSTSGILRLQLMKNTFSLLTVRNNIITLNKTQEKSVFISSNGTFRISNLNWTDSGNYNLQTFDATGTATGERILYLFIQAPVSSVLLVSECLSQGEMRVSCFSEGGDSPQYSWTLDGLTLTDAELHSRNNNIITLKQHVSGHLVCSVRNNVNKVSKEERISTCGNSLLICGLRAVVAYCLHGVAQPSLPLRNLLSMRMLPLVAQQENSCSRRTMSDAGTQFVYN